MKELYIIELLGFQKILNANSNIIDNGDYKTNDLVKAMSLSGIFYRVIRKDGKFINISFSGSGMLDPGQEFVDIGSYKVHTCKHALASHKELYFVPYGVAIDQLANDDSSNSIFAKGFLVTTHCGNSSSDPYSQNDYLLVCIEGKTKHGSTLKNILSNASCNIVKTEDKCLPKIDGTVSDNISADDENRLFIIGYPNYCANECTLGTTLTNDGRVVPADKLPRFRFDKSDDTHYQSHMWSEDYKLNRPLRSLQDDPDEKFPSKLGNINEYFSFLVSAPGMSGGPIFRCKLGSRASDKKCSFIGTNWGAERIFNIMKELKGFRNFINKLPKSSRLKRSIGI
ncbi:MAG: hypothetical protein LBT90_01860 [Holosporaceae bacterium]|jgi:hypothetical protein|nr:hypothetical protein [Holosporaceae bacterium]